MANKLTLKISIVLSLLIIITSVIFLTKDSQYRYHSVFREFYFIPLILATFWFGLRGALLTSGSITLFYIIFLVFYWQGISAEKINTFIEIIFLNLAAVIFGTLRERENKQRRRAQKAENLAAIGKAVSGVAHDMKTPLVAIAGFARQILKKMREDEPHRDKLDIIHREAQRLESMVKDMLDFARPLDLRLAPADVNQLLRESLEVAQDLAREQGVTMETQLGAAIPLTLLDAGRMKQVLINLVINAIQASPAGETVMVRSALGERNITIEVVDRGGGIPPDQKENIFVPFFTTKKEGVGLGLSMVKNIVSAHHGSVEFFDNRNPSQGVTFRITLPREATTGTSVLRGD
jgi:two-component system, NtrC family, sensor histidine kinase HydH